MEGRHCRRERQAWKAGIACRFCWLGRQIYQAGIAFIVGIAGRHFSHVRQSLQTWQVSIAGRDFRHGIRNCRQKLHSW